MCILTLRFNKKLVGISIGESNDFGLYTRAISRPNTLDLTIIER